MSRERECWKMRVLEDEQRESVGGLAHVYNYLCFRNQVITQVDLLTNCLAGKDLLRPGTG